MPKMQLTGHNDLLVRQRHEVAEWVGFETRNKYEILKQDGQPVAFAAEQQKGFLGFLFRQFLGHWRSYEIHFYTPGREQFMVAYHPFRFIFQRLEIRRDGRNVGAIQQRFSILTKKFDVEDETGNVIMEVASPFWRIWSFLFTRHNEKVASVQKKWSGVFTEFLTDKDNFLVEFSPRLSEADRSLVLAAALFIDLKYFEKKAGGSKLSLFQD